MIKFIFIFLISLNVFATTSRYTKKLGLNLSYQNFYSFEHFYLGAGLTYRFDPKYSLGISLGTNPFFEKDSSNEVFLKEKSSSKQVVLGAKDSYTLSLSASFFLNPESDISPLVGLSYVRYAHGPNSLYPQEKVSQNMRKRTLTKSENSFEDLKTAHFLSVYGGFDWQVNQLLNLSLLLNWSFKVYSDADLENPMTSYIYPQLSLSYYF